jgi:exodeoxyribonuclease VII large subunit
MPLVSLGPRQLDADLRRDIFSVSRLASEVRYVLEGSFPLLWVRGELSNLAQPASGHLYFTLKDEAAQVRCALFRPKRLLLGFQPTNGQQVLVRARVTLFEPRGDFQLVIEHMEPGGEGALRLELERLKRRLAAEGLFAESVKRPIPPFPRQVGLITSPSGAAVHDLVTVLGRRFRALPILIYPAQVQGVGAVETLLQALRLANARADCDVLILARGGGSLEDLAAFNDETLARAIRASAIPVVTGIGHEVDLTIADLVADRRAATPSAAAELVAPSGEHVRHRVSTLAGRLAHLEGRLIQGGQRRLEAAARHLRLLHPAARLRQQIQRLDETERRLLEALEALMRSARERLQGGRTRLSALSPRERLARVSKVLEGLTLRLHWAQGRAFERCRQGLNRVVAGLEARSPLATLARGYAIVSRVRDGAIVGSPADAPPGTRIEARLREGRLRALVEQDTGE